MDFKEDLSHGYTGKKWVVIVSDREGVFFLAVRLNEGTLQSSCPTRGGIHQRVLREQRTRRALTEGPCQLHWKQEPSCLLRYNLGNAGVGGAPVSLALYNSIENRRILYGDAWDIMQKYQGKSVLWKPWQKHFFKKTQQRAGFLQ